MIDKKTSGCLRNLKDCGPVRFEAFVTKDEWTDRLKLWKGKGGRSGLTVTVNIYGARTVSRQVSKRLSKAGLFLQHPEYCSKGVEYENPHYFKLPYRVSPQPSVSSTIYSPETLEDTSQRPNVAHILDTLSSHQYLQDALIDSRVKTSLLPSVCPSQITWSSASLYSTILLTLLPTVIKERVYVLWSKGNVGMIWMCFRCGKQEDILTKHCWFPSFEICVPTVPFNSHLYIISYQHTIVGTRRTTRPDERCGGILADDMGLGKSLTTLSTIVGSLHRAQDYAESSAQPQPSNCNAKKSAKPAGKATLIIVPSASELDPQAGISTR